MQTKWEGDWIGHYDNPNALHENGGHRFALRATLKRWGGGLTGTMADLDPTHDVPYHVLVESPLARSWSVAERAAVQGLLDGYPLSVMRTTLPERSELVGKVSGAEIEFEKRYLGPQTTVTLDGERELGRSSIADHRVQYRGTQSEDGREIVGTWTIRAPGLRGILGKNLGKGGFRLVRPRSLG